MIHKSQTTNHEQLTTNHEPLTLIEHLEELRRRIIICLIAVFVCSIVCYFYVDKILFILSRPVNKLVFLKPTEAFLTKLKLSFYSGFFVSMPVIIYQIWKFVSPGLLPKEKHYIYWIVPTSYLLFITGVLFAFFAVLPVGIKFLLSYATESIQPLISISAYISFVIIFLLVFGIVFQLPLIVLFLTKLGVITPKWLVTNRKYAILVVFILAGILTPGPDVFSQFLMAIPTLLLYELSIIISKIVHSLQSIKK